jgi:ERCC4-type nuclease
VAELVLVDVFERDSRPLEALQRLGVKTELRRLPVGDYDVGSAIVERKSVRDLHLSIVRSRFWPQVGRLARSRRTPYLLVEGPELDAGPLRPAAVRGALLAVSELGVGLIRSTDAEDSALWLKVLAGRSMRRRPRRVYPRAKRADPSVAVIAAVPGFSSTSAQRLLDRFGSVSDIVAAGPENWLSVPGVGPKRARSLWEALAAQRRPS